MQKKRKSIAKRADETVNDVFDFDADTVQPEETTESESPKSKVTGVTDSTASRISLEERKLTAKQLKALSENGSDATQDAFIGTVKAEAAKRGRSGDYENMDDAPSVFGIPCPALAFEYLLGLSGFPLGMLMQINAKWGTGKTSLVAEFIRWFDACHGIANYNDNETKHSPSLFRAIHGEACYKRIHKTICTSVEEWQTAVSDAIDTVKMVMEGTKAAPGEGKRRPALFVVDSIMGKLAESNRKKTEDDGFASAAFPKEALLITAFLRARASSIVGWPFALVAVNHIRETKDKNGNPTKTTPGGAFLSYQQSFEIEMQTVKNKILCSDFQGYQVRMSTTKNSLASGHRSIQTRMLWWFEDDENGKAQQRCMWDWDWATVKLLNDFLNGDKTDQPMIKSRLKKMGFHLVCPKSGDAENSAWSKNLGMTAEDAVSWNELGRMIREDKALMVELRKALCILDMPYLETVADVVGAAAEETPKRKKDKGKK